MNRFKALVVSAMLLCPLGFSSDAWAAAKMTTKKLKKDGVKLVSCPPFIANAKSGLYTGIQKKTTVCTKDTFLGKSKKASIKSKMVVDGSYNIGQTFTPVQGQEGDVQTEPFVVAHYPALIDYNVTEANFKSTFRIAIVNADTGKDSKVFFRSRGSVNGQLTWNTPGRFYLKINAFGDSKEELQPSFSVSLSFMATYEGMEVSKSDMKEAGLKTVSCPRQVIDLQTGRTYALTSKYICAKNNELLEDAGFTAAPFSFGAGMFMADEISNSGAGGYISLPFRVNGPTAFDYSVDDPSTGKGSTNIYLIDLATGSRVSKLVDVKGSISGTTTSINIPGDYYLEIDTSPSKPQEFGDIEWSIDIAAAP